MRLVVDLPFYDSDDKDDDGDYDDHKPDASSLMERVEHGILKVVSMMMMVGVMMAMVLYLMPPL